MSVTHHHPKVTRLPPLPKSCRQQEIEVLKSKFGKNQILCPTQVCIKSNHK